ncbi:hypothetical protein [Dactylosporangium sp. NPDC048998]|uniref:GP88 family protein n=1 Tax=Dactylosporangium sp. NPDC048998 TaxID=3363976 RepID=UPI0037241251
MDPNESYGGTQDHTLDPAVDRGADIFPDEAAITVAGWSSQEASDPLAVLGPPRVEHRTSTAIDGERVRLALDAHAGNATGQGPPFVGAGDATAVAPGL